MTAIDLGEAMKSLSRLVEAIESGAVAEVIITRNGEAAARLVSVDQQPRLLRVGVAAGQFVVPENIDDSNDEIAESLKGGLRSGPGAH